MADAATAAKMRDGIIKRGSTWSYVLRQLDLSSGKTKPKWVGGFPTRKAAKAARDSARHATNRGTYVERRPTTLGEWMATWLDVHAVELRPSTLSSYRIVVRLYVSGHPIAYAKLQGLTPTDLSAHWRQLQATGGKGGKPLSARTVRYAHSVVRKALGDAVADRQLEVNPAVGTKLPRAERAAGREPDAWAPEALRAFLEATADSRLGPLWVLMAYTGMRRGEALALQWDDVDLDHGTITVRRAVGDVDGTLVYNETTKNGERRTITAPSAARAALRTWRKAQAAEQLAAGKAWQNTRELVFTMPDGSAMTPSYATKSFGKAAASTRAPTITLHGLRHTAATLLLRDGASVHLVAKMLGHRDPTVTLTTYAHAIPGDDSVLADQLERIVSG